MKLFIVLSLFIVSNTVFVFAQKNLIPKEDSSKSLGKIETEAYFPRGNSAWPEYLQKHIRANIAAKKKAPAGSYTVVIKFAIGKDGKTEEITGETNYGYGMENEVMRVIEAGPRWMPAMQNGKIVRAYRRQPITFVVNEK